VPPNNPCLTGVCVEFSQSCMITVGNDGLSCEDGNPCTGGEVCSSGQCVGGQPANNGKACDDGNGCTSGTTCSNGVCTNPASQILACMPGDNCCPAGCSLNQDSDCLYWVPGVQTDVPQATLQGWSMCFSGKYGDNFPDLNTVMGACNKSKLLMACRPVGAANWSVVAMAPKTDVTFDTGTGNTTHIANGVGWYFNSSYSWGFAPQGDAVSRSSCDIEASSIQPGGMDGDKRICWHTGGNSLNGGWRCGKSDSLNSDNGWERALFQAD
jgi:hypothetical protein